MNNVRKKFIWVSNVRDIQIYTHSKLILIKFTQQKKIIEDSKFRKSINDSFEMLERVILDINDFIRRNQCKNEIY